MRQEPKQLPDILSHENEARQTATLWLPRKVDEALSSWAERGVSQHAASSERSRLNAGRSIKQTQRDTFIEAGDVDDGGKRMGFEE